MAGDDHGGSDGGSIIFVSSIAARRPSPNELVYGAAKAGVENLTYGLARTLGPKVRVNCIAPGPFLTDISRAWDLDAFERLRRRASRSAAAAAERDRGNGAVPRERRIVVHHRRRDRRRRRPPLIAPGVRPLVQSRTARGGRR
jgi:NAD(P)-dependent dehydrogenase (short-subunit alcohol dehydrogenase family)